MKIINIGKKTPRGILPVNSNSQNSFPIACGKGILACILKDFGIYTPYHAYAEITRFLPLYASKPPITERVR